ncbi:MAG: DNA topoisomerase III [Inhella sp.]
MSLKTLVIAEKPSVALDIVRALTPQSGKFEKHDEYHENDHYIVSSAVGHLVEIAAPEGVDPKRGKWSFANLPVIPPHFDLQPIDKSKSRLNALVKLIRRKDVEHIINACDAGREGELIFRLIVQYAQPARGKFEKKIERLWLQSMTPQAIRDGFAKLRSDAELMPLAEAARCRSEADWLVGINGTRAMTAFNSRDGGFFLTTVGRVQTPTLSIVVEREEKIRKHVARDYWEVRAQFDAVAGQYEGKYVDPAFKKGDDPEARADRLWDQAAALAIAAAVKGQPATVMEESKPSTQASPALFDLTSLQREANGRFGFSAKTTLALAQALYEKHKALTYPRTDSRHLPEDYLAVAKQTAEMLKDANPAGLGVHAATALKQGYIKPTKKVFDNTKVSDHFAIIPTLQPPGGLSEAEAKLYELVVKRFLAVFFPAAEFQVTTRISEAAGHRFQTNGKVLVNPGWLAIYGKEAQDDDATLVPVAPGEKVRVESVDVKGLQTKPPARYNEATLLGAMEGAGKLVDDDELREAMAERGLGTPATRAAIIEGLITEKYMLREGRDLIPTAKAFQLMTLLRGLEVEELTQPELTGQWEYQLAQMEKGKLSREAFMADIAKMSSVVAKAKSYDRDTIPGDYATLQTLPELRRRGEGELLPLCLHEVRVLDHQDPRRPQLRLAEVEAFLQAKRIGPLEGFRLRLGRPFTAELQLVFDDEIKNWKLEFDFGDDKHRRRRRAGRLQRPGKPGRLPCARAMSTRMAPTTSASTPGAHITCDFKSGKVILTQPVERAQMGKLLHEGGTDFLENFVSNRTRRKFKAKLVWDGKAGKVNFEFEPRAAKAPRKAPAKKVA